MKVLIKEDKIVIEDFSSLEALRIAMHLEKQGEKFYSDLKEHTLKENKEVIEFLEREEKKHYELFDNLFEKQKDNLQSEIDLDEEILVDFADSKIFNVIKNIEDASKILKDEATILKLGIILENRSIEFYEYISKNIDDIESRKIVDIIISEEKSHKEKLSKLYLRITG